MEMAQNGHISIMLLLLGRPSKQGHFFLNSLASMNYGQIVQYFDIPRKIGWILFIKILQNQGCRVKSVSYTHLTLPTILRV